MYICYHLVQLHCIVEEGYLEVYLYTDCMYCIVELGISAIIGAILPPPPPPGVASSSLSRSFQKKSYSKKSTQQNLQEMALKKVSNCFVTIG